MEGSPELVHVICFNCRREMTVDPSIGATVAVCALCAVQLRRYPDPGCERDLRRLIRSAWCSQRAGPLTLAPAALPEPGSSDKLDEIVAVILAHVRKTCPELPEVRAAAPARYGAIGSFGGFSVDSAGFATILVDESLRDHYDATHAVLCHEVMHQVLHVAGLALPERFPNEQRTDRMMFIAGLGQIFLRGHRQHRAICEEAGDPALAGYHTHTQLLVLEDWARSRWRLRTDNKPDPMRQLYRRLLARYSAPAQVAARIRQVRSRNPGRSDRWIYEWLLHTR